MGAQGVAHSPVLRDARLRVVTICGSMVLSKEPNTLFDAELRSIVT